MSSTTSRSERLLAAASDTLTRAARVRFVQEVTAGTVADVTFAHYLRIEEDFVRTACRLHGMAVWDAPTATAIDRHAAALHGLTTEQTAYFADARARWLVPAALGATGHAAAEQISTFATGVARAGGHAGVVTVMFAAEWLYQAWCADAAASPALPAGPVGDWVRLHARAPFTTGVEALRDEVDAIDRTVPERRLLDWFEGMLNAEIAFHEAVYDVEVAA